MKKLYIVRHAEAEDSKPDKERKLTNTGIEQSNMLGKYLYNNNLIIDLIIASSSIRTLMTAEYIKSRINFPNELIVDDDLYKNNDILYEKIKTIDDNVNSLMIISHNPAISNLIYRVNNNIDFKPATLAVFDIDTQSWKAITEKLFKLNSIVRNN